MSTQRPRPDLLWFQHVLGGSKHGFDAAGIAQAQENYAVVALAEAQGLPSPVFPRHPMDDIASQIRTGKLVPCAPPTPEEINTFSLSDGQIAELEKQDLAESKAEKRRRLQAELDALGDEDDEETHDVPGPDGGVAGAPTGPGTTARRGGRAKPGAQE